MPVAKSPLPPLLLPRGLIFLASVWLVSSWLLAIGIRAPVQPSSASYPPGVRQMLLCVAAGLMIGWPLLRLSQTRPPYPIRQTLLDLLVLLGLALAAGLAFLGLKHLPGLGVPGSGAAEAGIPRGR